MEGIEGTLEGGTDTLSEDPLRVDTTSSNRHSKANSNVQFQPYSHGKYSAARRLSLKYSIAVTLARTDA